MGKLNIKLIHPVLFILLIATWQFLILIGYLYFYMRFVSFRDMYSLLGYSCSSLLILCIEYKLLMISFAYVKYYEKQKKKD